MTISKDDLESSLNLDFLHLYAWGECVSIIVGSKGHDGPLWMLIYHNQIPAEFGFFLMLSFFLLTLIMWYVECKNGSNYMA